MGYVEPILYQISKRMVFKKKKKKKKKKILLEQIVVKAGFTVCTDRGSDLVSIGDK